MVDRIGDRRRGSDDSDFADAFDSERIELVVFSRMDIRVYRHVLISAAPLVASFKAQARIMAIGFQTKEAAKAGTASSFIVEAIETQPDYCGHPQLYQTWVQYIQVIARPSTLPAARSSVSSVTSTVRIVSSPSTQSATTWFMELFP